MKKLLLSISTILCFSVLLTNNAFASHAVGADISYTCVGQDSFRVTVNFYRDCDGIDAPLTVPLQVSSSCTTARNYTLSRSPLVVLPNGTTANQGSEVSGLCQTARQFSTCQNGNYPGIQQYQYTGLVVLSQQCSDWTFAFAINARNATVTNLVTPDQYDLYVQATLNNTVVSCNSSPVFTNRPVPYICYLENASYNQGSFDADGDSLVYTLINPLEDQNLPIPYAPGYSVTNPIATNGPFNFNPLTGQLSFVPSGPQVSVITVLVQEYRNGVLIGTTMRDIQVVILGSPICNPPYDPVNFTGIDSSSLQGAVFIDSVTLESCPGDTIRWTIALGGDSIFLFAGLDLGNLPGATFDTVRINLDSITGIFSWIPTALDTGRKTFTLNYGLTTCPILREGSQSISINVLDGTYAGPDLTYCPAGDSVQLFVVGGSSFTWTPAAGLSSTTVRNPLAAPAFTTDYIVVSDLSARCKNRDTVRVEVVPNFILALDPANDTVNICRNGMVQLSVTADTAFAPYTYSWSPAATLSDSTSANPRATPQLTTTYIVAVTSDTGCTIKDTITVNVTSVGPKVIISAAPGTQVCPGDTVTLTGNVYPLSCGPSIGSGECGPGNGPQSRPFGTGTGTGTLTPLGGANAAYRYQVLYRAADLAAAGITSGTITRLQMNISSKASTGVYTNLTIKMGCTGNNQLTRIGWEPVSQQVFYSSSFLTQAGVNNFVFSQPYDWDGISNIVIEFCFGGGPSAGGNDGVLSTNTSYLSSMAASSGAGIDGCVIPPTQIPASQPASVVPNITFFVCGARPRTYTYQWSPSALVTSPATPVTQTVVNTATSYTLAVSDTQCTGQDFINITIDTTNISVTPDTALCNADSIQLMVNVNTALPSNCGANGNTCGGPLSYYQVGTGTVINANESMPAPYAGFYEGAFQQYLYTAADLTAMGVTPGRIQEIAFYINTVLTSPATFRNFTIKAKCTNIPALTIGSPETGMTQVFNPRTVNVAVGWNNHVLDNAFDWDGTSNLVFELCYNNNTNNNTIQWSNNSISPSTATTGYLSSTFYRVDDDNSLCSNPVLAALSSLDPDALGGNFLRPNTRFRMCRQPLPYTVSWSPGNTLTDSTIANPIAFPSTATTYVVTVNTPSGCTRRDSVTVNVGGLVYTISNDTTVCPGSQVQLQVTGGNQYSWTPTTGLSCTTCPNPVATVFLGTTYRVTITDSVSGCSSVDSVRISRLPTPPPPFGNDTFICFTDSLVLNAGPGYVSYVWSVPGPGNTGQTITINTAGDYSVTVTAPNGCVIADTITIGVRAAPPVNIGRDTIMCLGDSVTLNAGLGYTTYNWSNGDTDDTTKIYTTGLYRVTVTDANGCPSSDTMQAYFNPVPVANLGPDRILCADDTLILVAGSTPGYTYLWNDGSTDSILVLTSNYFSDTVIVTIFGGGTLCSDMDTIVVDFRAPISVDLGPDTFLCNGGPIVLDAGAGFVTYVWSPAVIAAQTRTVTAGGTYCVTATDAFGCAATDCIIIADSTPVVNLGNDILTCVGTTVTLDAGAGFLTYLWNTTESTQTIDVTTDGNYSVTVTSNLLGCFASDIINVTFLPYPVVNLGPDTTVCAGSGFILNAGNAGASYLWQDGTVSQTLVVNTPGLYYVDVTNAGNCTTRDSIIVSFFPVTEVDLGNDTAVCVGEAVTFDAGTDFVAFSWTGPFGTSNQQAITVVPPGTYIVVATDSNGCTDTDSVTLSNIQVTVSLGPDRNICGEGSITLDAGAGFASYLWSPNGEVTRTIIADTAGTYSVTVTDGNGCSGTDAVIIGEYAAPTPNLGNDTTVCAGTGVTLDPGTFASYNWGTTTDSSLTVTASGTYSVTVTDANGCTASDAIVVTVLPAIAPIDLQDVTFCLANGDTAVVAGPAGFVTYSWSDSSTTQDLTTTEDGTYSLTVADANGCTASATVIVGDGSFTVQATVDPTSINAGELASLDAQVSPSGTYNYLWTPSASVTDSTIKSPGASPLETTTFTVFVTDPASGCTASDTVTLTVFDESVYAFPEAFTPGTGTTNNYFYIITNGSTNIVLTEFKIYNRWGQLVHDNPTIGWDGTIGGTEQPQDTYVFSAVIEITTATGVTTETVNGAFTLLR